MTALDLLQHYVRQVNLLQTIAAGSLLITLLAYQTTSNLAWLMLLGPVVAALFYTQLLVTKHIRCVWCRADFFRLLHNGFYLDTKGLKACPFCAKRLDDELKDK